MQSSEQINELALALSKAQGEITGALKDSANPFFRSKYADLASCWDACRPALAKNAIAVIQIPEVIEGHLCLTTTLAHSSGQWMRGSLPCNPKDGTDQATGSSITYARRYALAAFVGIAQVDDDGNAASGRGATMNNDARGDLGHKVPTDKAKAAAGEMTRLMDADILGDHEGTKKAISVLDYHDKVLNPDPDLYVAAAAELPANKRNAWKAFISQARAAEKADAATDPSGKGRRF